MENKIYAVMLESKQAPSKMYDVYDDAEEISERHRHRYEFNPEFRATLESDGLVVSGISPDGKFVEIVELSREVHPWFLACQFHPEYKSRPLDPHPLFASFVRAAFEHRLRNETTIEKIGDKEFVAHERAAVASDN